MINTKCKQQGSFRLYEMGVTFADQLLTSAMLHYYRTAYNMMARGCEHLHAWNIFTELYTVNPW